MKAAQKTFTVELTVSADRGKLEAQACSSSNLAKSRLRHYEDGRDPIFQLEY